MKVIDTNLFIRYFTQDDPLLAKQAKNIFELDETLFIPEVVFPEIEDVLRIRYHSSKEEIVLFFELIQSKKNFQIEEHVLKALNIFTDYNLDMADCLIIAHALKRGKLESFDKRMKTVFEKLSKN